MNTYGGGVNMLLSRRGGLISRMKKGGGGGGVETAGGKSLIAKSFFYMVGAFGAFGCFNEGGSHPLLCNTFFTDLLGVDLKSFFREAELLYIYGSENRKNT